MKILIFMDKLSSSPTKDEEDTLNEAIQVKQSLIKQGHKVYLKSFTLNLEENNRIIKKINPDFIFNLVESLNSTSSLHLAALQFEQNNIAYSGGNSYSLFVTGNKVIGKQFLKTHKIKTADFYFNNSSLISSKLIGKKVILKPICDEASRGIDDNSIRVFNSKKELKTYMNNNPEYFIEEYIEGREFNISAMMIDKKVVVLPIAEMKFIDFPEDKPKILNYKSKWDEESFEYMHSQRAFNTLEDEIELQKELYKITKKCYSILGNKGYLRVDFRVDNNSNPYVLEVNVNPCITDDAGFTAAAELYGMDYDDMIKNIIN
jgi:D-alanine-D-alanine ligase